MSKKIDIDELLTLPQAAQLIARESRYRLSVSRLRTLAANSEIVAIKMGRAWFIARKDALAYARVRAHYRDNVVRPRASVRKRNK